MRRIRLEIMYDGKRFAGWQIQPNAESVQGFIEEALGRMTGEEIRIVGASRTDAGVHALGQVAHFDTESGITPGALLSGLNALLPREISVALAQEAPLHFHARKDAQGKRYLYRIFASSARDPFLEGRAWHLQRMPDIERMRKAAGFFFGEHDFESFRAAGCFCRHAVRKITRLDIEVRGPLIEIVFEGNGFVRHMIRNIVGTLVEAGEGRIDPDDVERIIEARKRSEAGRCAPASGLFLVKIFY